MALLKAAITSDDGSDWIEVLLDRVSIVTWIRGRMRFKLDFDGDEILGDTLRRELQRLPGCLLASYSERTRNALVLFDEKLCQPAQVAQAVLGAVREFARVHGECDLDHHHHHERAEDCDHDHSAMATDAGIRKELLKITATGALLGYFVYRKVKGKPMRFAGNPLLDVTSLITIASGYSIFRDGVDSLQKNRRATDDTLISIAVIATLLMGESLTGLSVVWLINLGRLLEAVTLKRSRTAIKDLMGAMPSEAWLLAPGGQVRKVGVEKVSKQARIRVFHGEKVPLDGKIARGTGALQEAFITGEAIPREKSEGETVYAGSVLAAGEIDVQVTSLAHDTVVARIVDIIENLRDRKAPIERVGDRFASKFVPISIGASGLTFLATGDLRRAITMLVIACPCAAGLATPTAVSAAIGQAARKGILIKGGTHLEMAARIDTLVFDKTGTLTEGAPRFLRFEPYGELALSLEEVLRLAASAEQHSTHPLGAALLEEAKRRSIALSAVEAFKILPGLGIDATVEGRRIHVGNARYFKSLGHPVPESEKAVSPETLLLLAVDGRTIGMIVVQDPIRAEARAALAKLRELGIKRVVLATGDRADVADFVAEALGIVEVYSEMMPEDKLALVRSLRGDDRKVAMVGDGVNDAQAFAEADLSIAMGGGHCDIAIETADVTLGRGDLLLVPEVIKISRRTLRTIYENFAASVGINAGGVAFGALGKLTPFSAAIVHNAATIAVVLNSFKLGRQVAGSNPLAVLGDVKI